MKKYLLLVSLSFALFVSAQTNYNKPFIENDSQVSYTYKAVFDSRSKEAVINRISSEFNTPKVNKNDLVWNYNGSYEIVVRENDVNINFGKSNDNQALYEKVKTLGKDLSTIVSQPVFKHRLITEKFYVVNDKANTFSYRGVFTLNKRANIKKSIEKYFGDLTLNVDNFVWKTADYDIILKKDQVEFSMMKNNSDDSFYQQFLNLEKELTEIITNPGPKNTLITTKNYALNDNPMSYTYKAVFRPQQNDMVKDLIETQFGKGNLSGGDLVWNRNGSYEISLSDYQLKINLGKSNDTESIYQQIKELGTTITKALNY
ncbi:hypothetical protein ACTS94_14390 [Empedobacter falsenii]